MRFVVDSMLGKLTRFLRIFGYDTVYANDLESYYKINPIPDNKLLEYAIKTDRIIITRDYPFYKKAKDRIVLVEGNDVYNYLKQLMDKLNLNYKFDIKNARCSICNSTLKEVKDKNSIKNQVKSQTFSYIHEFFQCENPNCMKVFWWGTHIENILKKINNNAKSDQ